MKEYFNILKISGRGMIPRMMDTEQNNPYLDVDMSKQPGYDLVRPGDEGGFAGLGTRFRGKLSPSGFSEVDQYGQQREDDIPVVNHYLIDNDETMGDSKYNASDGVPDGELYDSDSPLSRNYWALTSKKDIIGPHNMSKGKDVFFKGIRDRIR